MRYKLEVPILALTLLALAACSSEPDDVQTSEEHLWKDQSGAIDKAREVETILKRKHDQQEQQ